MGQSRAAAGLTCAVLAASFLGACGGGGSGSSAAEGKIESMLESYFTTADPDQCELLTAKAVQQIAPSIARADDPGEACRKEVAASDGQSAKSIEADVDVDGSNATATVTPEGGLLEDRRPGPVPPSGTRRGRRSVLETGGGQGQLVDDGGCTSSSEPRGSRATRPTASRA